MRAAQLLGSPIKVDAHLSGRAIRAYTPLMRRGRPERAAASYSPTSRPLKWEPRRGIIADYHAQSTVERELVLRLASQLWRLRRPTNTETGSFAIQATHLPILNARYNCSL
jgi:hypothetical protein